MNCTRPSGPHTHLLLSRSLTPLFPSAQAWENWRAVVAVMQKKCSPTRLSQTLIIINIKALHEEKHCSNFSFFPLVKMISVRFMDTRDDTGCFCEWTVALGALEEEGSERKNANRPNAEYLESFVRAETPVSPLLNLALHLLMTNVIFLFSHYATHRKRSTSVKHMEGADTVDTIQELFAQRSVFDTFSFTHYVQDCVCQVHALSLSFYQCKVFIYLFIWVLKFRISTRLDRTSDVTESSFHNCNYIVFQEADQMCRRISWSHPVPTTI